MLGSSLVTELLAASPERLGSMELASRSSKNMQHQLRKFSAERSNNMTAMKTFLPRGLLVITLGRDLYMLTN
jgi:hypothetical protein